MRDPLELPRHDMGLPDRDPLRWAFQTVVMVMGGRSSGITTGCSTPNLGMAEVPGVA